MASDLPFCSGARTRTWDLRVMSFAPGVGASELTFMLARLPVGLRCPLARMSSMARSTVDRTQPDVNGEIGLHLEISRTIDPPMSRERDDDAVQGVAAQWGSGQKVSAHAPVRLALLPLRATAQEHAGRLHLSRG